MFFSSVKLEAKLCTKKSPLPQFFRWATLLAGDSAAFCQTSIFVNKELYIRASPWSLHFWTGISQARSCGQKSHTTHIYNKILESPDAETIWGRKLIKEIGTYERYTHVVIPLQKLRCHSLLVHLGLVKILRPVNLYLLDL